MHIRLAEPADISALNALIEQSIRGLQTNDYTPAQIEGALGHALGLDTQLIADRHYFVAESEDGRLAACGGWSNRRTLFGSDHGPCREDDFLDPAVDAAKIRAIFVHPEFARQGLGSRMLAHCEAAAVAAGFRRFEMGSTMTGIALYRLKGYADGELVQVPLPNGEHLPILRMTKALPAG
ncbi:Acetyltransferase (GNAT) family protein [Granulicella rosea]|uniref:Acetyltransferase (GNAT) family protein n=1 Tax=Granulicella rosea TaxID=474952 RepID=A0A239EWX9_9BACT|nr:GNAT family N-acetyltransferase [Granulicella rosea]SNS48324.1 Acetyltransferase (GNAT) family protein [Granulicella rosea]